MEDYRHQTEKTGIQEQIILEQQELIHQLEQKNQQLARSYDIISNAALWKISKPVRFILDISKWMMRNHSDRHYARAYWESLSTSGIHAAWDQFMHDVYFGDDDRTDEETGNETGDGTEKEPSMVTEKWTLINSAPRTPQRVLRFPRKIRFSILVPLYNTPRQFLREMIESVQAQTCTEWELCMTDGSDSSHGYVEEICMEYARQDSRVLYRRLEKNTGISGNTNACVEMASGEYIGLLDHDDCLHPDALYRITQVICDINADFIYTDECMFHESVKDTYNTHFKPDYSPDIMWGGNYVTHFSVFSRSLLEQAGPFDSACDGSQDYDITLRLTELAHRIVHIPEVLYYWRAHEKSTAMHVSVKSYAIEAGVRSLEKRLKRMGLQGEVTPIQPGIPNYRVRFAIQGTPKVSILIFDYDDPAALDACLESITRQSTWSAYEIVVMSRWEQKRQSRLPAETKKSRKKRRSNREKERKTAIRPEEKWSSIRFLTWKENSNYPAMINTGMESCEGDYVVLLSQNTQILTPDWIQEMLMYAQRDDVGAVGAKIYDGNNMIRHAGYAYDYSGIPLRIFHSIARKNMGYMGRLMVAQNLTAVSSDCMMFRRELPGLVNGFDDSFTEEFYDVDFCIRVRQAGFLIVWTPFCELCQTESEETLQPEPEDVRNRRLSDRMHFLYRWINETEAGDPYFNPRILLTEDENHPLQVRKRYSK